MARLSRTDMEAALSFAALVNEQAVSDRRSDAMLLAGLAQSIPSDVAVYSHIDETARAVLDYAAFPGDWDEGEPNERWEELTWAVNPFCRYRRETSDWSAVRRQDVVDMRQDRRTELFALLSEEARREFGRPTFYELETWIPTREGSHRLLSMVRSDRDYSMRDRLLLNVARPHIIGYERRRGPARGGILPGPSAEDLHLTPREGEILDLVASGATNAQIAERLWISPETVRKHLENVYLKLGVSSRTAALARTGRSRASSGVGED